MATKPQSIPPAPLYHVTDLGYRDSILREGLKAKAGAWLNARWKPRVFFVTNRMSAFELAQLFIHERHGSAYMFVLIDPEKIRGKLRQDLDFEHGVWTTLDVPPEAIIGTKEVDEDFFESREFLEHMGEWDEEKRDEDPSRIRRALNQTERHDQQTSIRTFRIAAGTPLYFATTLAPAKSGRPADGPEILTPQWLRQYGSPILTFPASEARDLLQRFTRHESGRQATASRPRILRFLATRDLTMLDRASIPEEPLNLSLLSTLGVSRREVLVSDLGLNGFVTDLRVGRPNRLPPCLLFELMDPLGSLVLNTVLHFPHLHKTQKVADPPDYKRWLAEDPRLPPHGACEVGPSRSPKDRST